MSDSSRKQLLEDLRSFGLEARADLHWNLTPPELCEEAIRRNEGMLSRYGSLIVTTGAHTGRAAKDKYFVRESSSQDEIWWNDGAKSLDEERYSALKRRVFEHLRDQELFIRDCSAGADAGHRLALRVITLTAWHSLFAENMFLPVDPLDSQDHRPDFTIVHAPSFRALPERDGTRSDVFIVINLKERLALIGGTSYAGEIKKSVFTVMNYLLPREDILSMHCSANTAHDGGNVALFFGLSGTGKTTLSADESRILVGDDEHGWGPDGIFNIEGGCYAKVINLSQKGEPQIFNATTRFGTIMENVVMDPRTRELDLTSSALTENTRASYPVEFIPHSSVTGCARHPEHIVMLTCDAFGVLPPIAALSPEQAQDHFLSGYTARVAGTESGVTEPKAVFSPCFGGPFLVHRPAVYAKLLGDKIARHHSRVWLINTGWQGGPYGVGKRINLNHTRAIISAALSGRLASVATSQDPIFGLRVPQSCPGVPSELLNPRASWPDPVAYDAKARELAEMFAKNLKDMTNH
ncbi:MAG: phosphoenolpyruvate carboxykinase (ATP) [Candidatus Hydrogenedentota bacterium]